MKHLEELKLLAEKATPGDWEWDSEWHCMNGVDAADVFTVSDVAQYIHTVDIAFITKANPKTILEIVEYVGKHKSVMNKTKKFLEHHTAVDGANPDLIVGRKRQYEWAVEIKKEIKALEALDG